jgi:phage shock protein C
MKKLYRSQNNRIFSGVIGGVGEYANIDPTLLRVGFVLITFFSAIFPGIIAYFIAVMIIPVDPGTDADTPPQT